MKPPHNLETTLRSLSLRQPSPGIRDSLFCRTAASPIPASNPTDPHPAWRLLQLGFAPLAATALCVLSAATLLPAPGSASRTLAAALPASAGSWHPPVGQVERNALPRPSFRSTTGATVASSFGSLLLRQTNVLAR